MRRTVLIVDDDPAIVSMLQLSFEHEGFTVRTASSGWEGLKMARAWQPDLIVLDLVLPDLDGFIVCEALKNHRTTHSIPVLALTGLCSHFSYLTALEAGVDGYLAKPYDLEEMLATANQLLQRSESTAGSSAGKH
jgi:DNA-binding response OmpR family regulator